MRVQGLGFRVWGIGVLGLGVLIGQFGVWGRRAWGCAGQAGRDAEHCGGLALADLNPKP